MKATVKLNADAPPSGPDDNTTTTFVAHDELLATLERINAHYPPVQTCSTLWNFQGFYSGPTSIAYLFYRLSRFYPSVLFKNQSLLDWAEEYHSLSSASSHRQAPNCITADNCGITNETLTHLALSAALTKDASLVNQLCSFSTTINSSATPGADDWYHGRAGYLYILRLVGLVFDDQQSGRLLARTIEETVRRMLLNRALWEVSDASALHGLVVITAQIALSCSKHGLSDECLVNAVPFTPIEEDGLLYVCHKPHRTSFLQNFTSAEVDRTDSTSRLVHNYSTRPGLWDGQAGLAWLWAMMDLEDKGEYGDVGIIAYNDL